MGKKQLLKQIIDLSIEQKIRTYSRDLGSSTIEPVEAGRGL